MRVLCTIPGRTAENNDLKWFFALDKLGHMSHIIQFLEKFEFSEQTWIVLSENLAWWNVSWFKKKQTVFGKVEDDKKSSNVKNILK